QQGRHARYRSTHPDLGLGGFIFRHITNIWTFFYILPSKMSLLHQIALTKVNGVGPVIGRHLLSHFGNAEAVFSAAKTDLPRLQGLTSRVIEALSKTDVLEAAEKELRFIEKHNIRPL